MQSSEKKSSGFNWGWGILVAIILGVSAMTFLVVKSSRVGYEMVMDDYYESEMDYDEKLKAQKRFDQLSSPVEVHQSEEFLVIQFPPECLEHEIIDGKLKMYRPSSESKDLVIPFELDEDAQIILEKSAFLEGKYKIQGNWYMNDERYNIDQDVYINF